MNSSSLERKIALFLVGAAFFLIPNLIVRSYFFPFIFPKIAFGSLLFDGALIALLISVIKEKRINCNVPLAIMLFLIFSGTIGLSIVFGVDWQSGVWGTVERMEGVFFLVNFLALYGIITVLFNTASDRILLIRFFLFGTLGTVLYAIGQVNNASGTSQGMGFLSSSLGNPALYASYLLFAGWFALYAWVIDRERWWRVFYGAMGAIITVLIVLAERRATFLAMIFGLILFAVAHHFITTNKKIKQWGIIGGIICIGLIASIFMFRDSVVIKSVSILDRVAHIGTSDSTTASRLVSAKIALSGFKEHPLFGWGHNDYFYVYTKHYDPANLTNDSQFFDKAHNKYAELISEYGVVGTGAYFIFILYLFIVLLRGLTLEKAVLLGGLGAYLFQNAFLFDTPSTYLGFTVLFGLITVYDTKGKSFVLNINRGTEVLFGAVIIGVVIYMMSLGNIIATNAAGIRMLGTAPQLYERPEMFIKAVHDFTDRGSFMNREMLINLAASIGAVKEVNTNNIISLKALYSVLKEDFDQRPNNYRVGVSLLKVLNLVYTSDRSVAGEFRNYRDKVVALGPKRPEAYYEAGIFELRSGNVEGILKEYSTAISLNAKYNLPYWYLGTLLYFANRPELAKVNFEKAIELGFPYKEPQALNLLIQTYEKLKDRTNFEKYVTIAVTMYPDVFKVQTSSTPQKK